MIRNCGHCHGSHDTVAQARLCAKRHDYTSDPKPDSASERPVETNAPHPRSYSFAELTDLITWPEKNVLRFALPRADGEAPLLFQTVKGTRRLFTDLLDGHGRKVEITAKDQSLALNALVEDQVAAERRYAELTGHCSQCGKFLRRPESVACGYGPDCYERKFGVKQPKVVMA